MSLAARRFVGAGAVLRCAVASAGAVLLCTVAPASAQQSLVLSGGGARGLAHAGAIVALEELGYDPRLVVGTSMGAIIGALYAAGYDSDSLRATIAAENWLERFSAEPLLIGRDRVAHRPLLSVGIGRDRFFEGVVSTTGVNQRLVELLFDAGVRAGNDFDRLPRRYRAVTADLASGEQVVLAAGDLPRAVRASMAVPGAFAPVPWNDRVLVDGGIINNLPVSVARSLSSDPVVAIDVLRPSPDVQERSAAALGVRAIRLLIMNAMRDTLPPDVLILPRLRSSFNESRFPADAASLIRAGYNAAREQAPPISTRTATDDAAVWRLDERPSQIDSVVVHADVATARLVRRMLAGAAPGAYDADAIVRRIGALYATGLFAGVWPRVETRDGASILHVEITPVAATTFATAASWDNDVGAAGWATLRQRVLLATPWELRGTVELSQLGQRASAEVLAFSTLLPGVTWQAGAHTGEERLRIVPDDRVRDRYRVSSSGGWAGLELHAPLRSWFVSALLRADRSEFFGNDVFTWGPFVRIAPAPEPDRVVGVEQLLEVERRLGDRTFTRMHIRYGGSMRLERARLALFLTAAGSGDGATPDLRPATTRELAPWLPHGSLRSQLLMTVGADVAYPIFLDGYARARLRGLAAGEGTPARGPHYGVEVGGVWPTVLGSLEIGVATGSNGRARFLAGITAH